jgi:selenocysteine-specific elongation factor
LIVHHGTSHALARVVRIGERYAQLRLAEPVVAARGDRVVLRAQTTVGGGRVLDPTPPRTPSVERLELLERGEPVAIVRALVRAPVRADELQRRGLLAPADIARGLAALRNAGDWYFSEEWLDELRERVRARLREHDARSPLEPGFPVTQALGNAPWANAVAPLLELERRGPRLYLPGTAPRLDGREGEAAALEGQLAAEGFGRAPDLELARFLEAQGRLVRVGDAFAVSPALYDRGVEALRTISPITLAAFRDELGISRRVAQLLLERYDADGLTRRVGDERVLRRAARR